MKALQAIFLSVLMLFSMQVYAQDAVSDSAITQNVKAKIAADQMLATSNIQVDVATTNNIVTLSGSLKSDSELSAIVELAESTVGVKEVDTSKLKVEMSNQPLTDTIITAKVKGIFIREELFGKKDIASMGISVETKDGVVFLTGETDNREQVDNAIKLAKSINGVKEVKYRVKVMKNHIPQN